MEPDQVICKRCDELESRLAIARHTLKLIRDLAWFRERTLLDPHEVFHLIEKALRECKSPSLTGSCVEKVHSV